MTREQIIEDNFRRMGALIDACKEVVDAARIVVEDAKRLPTTASGLASIEVLAAALRRFERAGD